MRYVYEWEKWTGSVEEIGIESVALRAIYVEKQRLMRLGHSLTTVVEVKLG